jgi:mRNA interferase MazF
MTQPELPVRGDVWWVAFDPGLAGKTKKMRPAVVVSNDPANRFLDRVQVVPLTTSVADLYPADALIMLNGERRKAVAIQLATVHKQRLIGWLARIAEDDMAAIERAIRIQLDL